MIMDQLSIMEKRIEELIADKGLEFTSSLAHNMLIQNILPQLISEMEPELRDILAEICDETYLRYFEQYPDGKREEAFLIILRQLSEFIQYQIKTKAPDRDQWADIMKTNFEIYSDNIERMVSEIYSILIK